MKLLNIGQNAKTIKSDRLGKYLTAIMYLSPYKLSGNNVCAQASPTCIKYCLNITGFGKFDNVQQARIKRTKLFFEDRNKFKELLYKEIQAFLKKCKKLNLKPALRLNGTSDLPWFNIFPEIFVDFPEIQHYNYTKITSTYKNYLLGKLPKNYHLTFSRSEQNEKDCLDFLNQGGTIAVVGHKRPRYWNGFITVNGDKHDLRFTEKKNRVVYLTPKGRLKYDLSGFVIR